MSSEQAVLRNGCYAATANQTSIHMWTQFVRTHVQESSINLQWQNKEEVSCAGYSSQAIIPQTMNYSCKFTVIIYCSGLTLAIRHIAKCENKTHVAKEMPNTLNVECLMMKRHSRRLRVSPTCTCDVSKLSATIQCSVMYTGWLSSGRWGPI